MTSGRLGVALVVVCGLLLLSMGGAVFAAPVTLPLMYLAVRRHPSRFMRWAGGVVAGLTTVEVVWAAVYFVGGEARPSIWLIPLATGLLVVAVFVTAGAGAGAGERGQRRRRRSRSPSPVR